MQAFDQDSDSNNYHVLMERIGICSFEKLKRERQGLFRCAGYFIGIAAFRRRFNKTWCIAGWLSGKEDHPAINSMLASLNSLLRYIYKCRNSCGGIS